MREMSSVVLKKVSVGEKEECVIPMNIGQRGGDCVKSNILIAKNDKRKDEPHLVNAQSKTQPPSS